MMFEVFMIRKAGVWFPLLFYVKKVAKIKNIDSIVFFANFTVLISIWY